MSMFTFKIHCNASASGCGKLACQSGMGYVGLLALLAILSTLALAFVHLVGVQVAANHARLQHMQSEYLAQSGANHAVWRLLNEPGFAPAADQYTMHAMAGGRYGYKVRKPSATTFSTIATVGTTQGVATRQSYVPYIIPSNVITAYGMLADPMPRYRRMVGAGFSDPADTVAAGSSETYWMDLEGCPLRKEAVMATIDDLQTITAAVWDGSTWGNATTLGTDGDINFKCFDIVYESQSGRALVVSRTGISTAANYNIWDGSAWVHPTSQNAFNLSSGAIRTLTTAACPGNNHILICAVSTLHDLELFLWDGTAFTSLGVIETSMAEDDYGAVQVVYERQSGDALLIYTARGAVRYRIWDGVSLGPENVIAHFTSDVFVMRGAPDPTSDYIILAGADKFNDLTVAVWDGDTWIDGREIETSLSNSWYSVADVAWESTGQDAVVAWAPFGAQYLRILSWRKGTALADSTVETGPNLGQQPWLVELHPVSQSEKIVLLGLTNTEVLGYSLWTGDQIKGDPAVVLGTGLTTQNDRIFDIAEADVPVTGGTGTGSVAANQPPVVDAGPDQMLIYPNVTIQFAGSVSDDGRPDPPATVTHQWSLVSGPDAVGFDNAALLDTLAKVGSQGTYVFRLTASDSELTAYDEVTITITTPQVFMAYGSDSVYIDMGGGITAISPNSSPKYKIFDGSTWSPNNLVMEIDPLNTQWLQLAASPVRSGLVMGALQDNNSLQLSAWNGTAWGHHLQFTTTSESSVKCFDVAYEQLTGDALVVGRVGAGTTAPHYTVWDGSAWVHTPPIPVPDTAAVEIQYLAMASDPFSDEILVGMVDGAQDFFLHQWDGNTFNYLGRLEVNIPAPAKESVEIVYEQQSGTALVMYGSVYKRGINYRIWNGTTLSSEYFASNFVESSEIIRAAADPASDHIFAAALDAKGDINVTVWNGSSWIDQREIEITAETFTTPCFDVAWLPDGSEVLVAWGHTNENQLYYMKWTKGSSLASSSIQVGPSYYNDIKNVQLLPIKSMGNIMVAGQNAVNGLYYSIWNGTTFTPSLNAEFLAVLQYNDTLSFDLAELLPTSGSGSGSDTDPPTPDPMTWDSPPAAVDSTSITMTATTASDPSGVEYYFECTTAGCHDSGWQSGTTYVDSGLSSGTSYVYRVKARDKSAGLNETGWSVEAKAATASNAMYVHDITMGYRQSGIKFYARATVWIKAVGGADLEGAVVSGEWSGSVSGTSMGTTGGDGQIQLESPWTRSGQKVGFTVTGVVKTGYTYTPGLNVETSDAIAIP